MKRLLLCFGFLLILSSCRTRHIDEKFAVAVTEKELSLSGNVIAKKLSGGFGGTMNFLVSNDSKQYVVRFLEHRTQEDLLYASTEVYNFNVASKGEYGPKVYFSDPLQGIMIMEYLSGKTVTDKDLAVDTFYVALANLLKKIHHGQFFKNSGFDVFRTIDRALEINKIKYSNYVPLNQVEQLITGMYSALLPHLYFAPCHNDLHAGNLVYLGNGFKAIDYGDAAQGDPYFDIATVMSNVCYKSGYKPEYEKILLEVYLGRQPSSVESAKLYIMKQIVLIKCACDCLKRITNSPEAVHQYNVIKVPSSTSLGEIVFDLSKSEDNLSCLKMLLNTVFENAQSQEFSDAVELLRAKDSSRCN